VRIILLTGIGTQFEILTKLHEVFVTCLRPPGAVLGKNTGVDIELHGNELDDADRRQGDFGKGTIKKAEQKQIERETEAVGCTAAGAHLEQILRG
jgi:hypothetical protein